MPIVIAALALPGCGIASGPGKLLARPALAPGGQSTIVGWMQNAEPAGWDSLTDRIILNRRGSDGLWSAYSILPDGRDEVCITCSEPAFPTVGAATNRGATDVSPNGRYVLLVVEKGAHPGRIGEAQTEPGRGVYDDLWLATVDGSHFWRLTDLPASANLAVNWPRFDRTGSQIVWAQMYAAASLSHPLGQWALKVARLAWFDDAPSLTDVRTYDPQRGRFFEPYGFSPDNSQILFASDVDVPSGFLSPSAFNAQIWTIDASRLDDLQRVSPPPQLHGPFSDYNEFAFYVPDTDRILISRTLDSSAHGMDYWTVNDDGTDPVRLTFMNQPATAQYLGYSVGGGIAFDPRDPRRFVAGVSHDLGTKHVQALFVIIR
ncbi:MAG: hypothetical protein ACLP50_13410 [Solirubrobacteraceae bacterium]